MAQRTLLVRGAVVSVDCGAKECARCERAEWVYEEGYCQLFYGTPFDWCGRNGHILRIPECLAAEAAHKALVAAGKDGE